MIDIYDLIDEQVELLKPELKGKFVYRISDEESNSYADTMYLEPPIITFYANNIERMTDKPIKQSIRELISHELLHVLQRPDCAYDKEKECQHLFDRVNFFVSKL